MMNGALTDRLLSLAAVNELDVALSISDESF